MIYTKPTNKQIRDGRIAKLRAEVAELRQWQPTFALAPVRLTDGRMAWLEKIEERFPAAGVWAEFSPVIAYGVVEYRLRDRKT